MKHPIIQLVEYWKEYKELASNGDMPESFLKFDDALYGGTGTYGPYFEGFMDWLERKVSKL